MSKLMQYDTVITYLIWKEKNVTAGVGFMSGRICSLTTLVNLNTTLSRPKKCQPDAALCVARMAMKEPGR